MITDFIWKAFEKTVDTRYYLEYKRYRDACCCMKRKQKPGGRMEKTG